MGRLASQEFHGLGETFQGGLSGQGHAYYRSYPAGNTHQLEQAQAEPPRKIPEK
jgi:hypothetical protein